MLSEWRLLKFAKKEKDDILLHKLMEIVNMIEEYEGHTTKGKNKKIVKVETNGPYIDFEVITTFKKTKTTRSYSIPFSIIFDNGLKTKYTKCKPRLTS